MVLCQGYVPPLSDRSISPFASGLLTFEVVSFRGTYHTILG
jgi:hypothetical protein